MKQLIAKIMILTLASAGFFGILYPEFVMSDQTYRVVDMEEERKSETDRGALYLSRGMQVGADTLQNRDLREDFMGILDAGQGQIVIKSRLAEWIEEKLDGSEQETLHRPGGRF